MEPINPGSSRGGTPPRNLRSEPLPQQATPGTQTHRNVSDRSRADYSVYLVKNEKDKVMAVLIETKLSSSATFEHAIAQVSPFVSSWGGLSSLSLSHLQVIGYYVKFETENAVPPLCFVLSEDSAQLVCFPFTDKHDQDAINCLVLPPIPLFLKVNTGETTKLTFYTVNRYLLALILLWTKPDEGVYNEAPAVKRNKLVFKKAVKKSLIKAHIQSETEKIRTQLQEALERAEREIDTQSGSPLRKK